MNERRRSAPSFRGVWWFALTVVAWMGTACAARREARRPASAPVLVGGISFEGTAAGVTDGGEPSVAVVGTERLGTVRIALSGARDERSAESVALAALNALETRRKGIRCSLGNRNQVLVVLTDPADALIAYTDDRTLDDSVFFTTID